MTDFRRSALYGNSTSGFPFFFPTLFGSGKDGVGTLTTTGDVGYLGSFGAKEFTDATLAAGQTLGGSSWLGTSTGALMIACTGTLTIAGTINANGENGTAPGSATASGKGGATCGGGTGGAGVSPSFNNNSGGVAGASATRTGHGLRPWYSGTAQDYLCRGAGSGAAKNTRQSADSATATQAIEFPDFARTAESYYAVGSQRLINARNTPVMRDAFGGFQTCVGVASTGGAVQPTLPSNSTMWPYSTVSTAREVMSLDWIPAGPAGVGGGVTATDAVDFYSGAGGSGGGGGGVIIIEARRLVLTAGYSITANGGNGSSAVTTATNGSNVKCPAAGGTPGCGGNIVIVCHELIGSTAAITYAAGSVGSGAATGGVNGQTMKAGSLTIIRV